MMNVPEESVTFGEFARRFRDELGCAMMTFVPETRVTFFSSVMVAGGVDARQRPL